MYANKLQLINVGDDRVVLKRGLHEVLVSGASACTITGPLVGMLDGTKSADEILHSFSDEHRGEAEQLLQTLVRRGMVTEQPSAASEGGVQSAFYETLGTYGANAAERLRNANVCIAGRNLISRALVRSLAECGVGRIGVSGHPTLANDLHPGDWPTEDGIVLHDEVPSEESLKDVSLIVAASDFGEVDALLQMNRLAIRLNKPFLPIWLSEMTGHVGPLNHPHDTACFRCYQLRSDSNNSNYDVARAVRQHISADPHSRMSTGLLPPMASVLGEIAAMEIVKYFGQFVPVETVGRMIEINLVSFSAVTRRVLKVPRCPDCSDVSMRSPVARTHGPQIPQGTGRR